ncbi:hypothetical protein EVAR_39597_1 [Eumeta japonica]|uniref:Uncharacterized protein n=1 Tax=Eumeta variegata TaxID=151549 RepID=A0A4C1Y4U7_EUMVA|nr:hypothetical protein EVAR_39597_1 [Eumeta japonica]
MAIANLEQKRVATTTYSLLASVQALLGKRACELSQLMDTRDSRGVTSELAGTPIPTQEAYEYLMEKGVT